MATDGRETATHYFNEKGKDVQRGRDGEISVEEAKNKGGNGNRNETDSPNSERERDG